MPRVKLMTIIIFAGKTKLTGADVTPVIGQSSGIRESMLLPNIFFLPIRAHCVFLSLSLNHQFPARAAFEDKLQRKN